MAMIANSARPLLVFGWARQNFDCKDFASSKTTLLKSQAGHHIWISGLEWILNSNCHDHFCNQFAHMCLVMPLEAWHLQGIHCIEKGAENLVSVELAFRILVAAQSGHPRVTQVCSFDFWYIFESLKACCHLINTLEIISWR